MTTLRGISTVVPPTVLHQAEVRDVFAAQPGLGRLARRLIGAAFDASGIKRRHSVIDEFAWDHHSTEPRFFDPGSGLLLTLGTRRRNELYVESSGPLFVEAAQRALDAAQIDPLRVTHVVTVSCTGFYAPGPEFLIVKELGLAPGTQRFHLGFMGCYATMPALRLAEQLVAADEDAVVLVVSVELCTLHVRSSDDPDQIVAASLFADGAAGCIVSSTPPLPGEAAFVLDAFETAITPVGEEAMAWKIGDEGFEMVLSTSVPHIIDDYVGGALDPLLAAAGVSVADLRHWAIHPGGRSILDRVETRLGLSEEQLTPSRETLSDYGNMSSATILFVLRRILDDSPRPGERVLAMAFGPGLTVESGIMTVC